MESAGFRGKGCGKGDKRRPESHRVLRMGAFICGKERLAEAVVFLGFLEKEGQNIGVLRGQLHGASRSRNLGKHLEARGADLRLNGH